VSEKNTNKSKKTNKTNNLTLRVQRAGTRSGRRGIHRIGGCTTHPFVAHPYPSIIPLLGSKTGKRSENDRCNSNSCDRTSRQHEVLVGCGKVQISTRSSPRDSLGHSTLLGHVFTVGGEAIFRLVFFATRIFPQRLVGVGPV